MKPQKTITRKSRNNSHHIILITDISKSMETTFRKQNRKEYAKRIAKILLRNIQGSNLYSLIFIAERPFIVVSETFDKNIIEYYINNIRKVHLPDEGTAVADAVLLALAKAEKGSAIVLLSDGGINRGQADIKSIIPVVKKYNIPIFAIAIGDSVIIRDNERVKTDYNEKVLMQLASASRGEFMTVDNFSSERIVSAINKLPDYKIEKDRKGGEDLYYYGAIGLLILLVIYLLLQYLGIYNPLE